MTRTSAACTSARRRSSIRNDLFSGQAAVYAASRPGYPDALFDFVATQCRGRSLAWDCATGNGQAATGLASRFARVVATDLSAGQLAHAVPAPNIEYRVSPAEDSGLAPASTDLVTVAQALHWLDHEPFYREVRRVARPGGIIAAWSYGACHAGDDVEGLLRGFEHATLGPFWDSRRRWVDEGYRTIPFPFPEVTTPPFELHMEWTVTQLCGYLRSWSAVATYIRDRHEDPVAPLQERLVKQWGSDGQRRLVRWPLVIRLGRVG